ncbi:hypothetical protein [Paenibacillus sp. FSL H3-0310]|uniref:hypothetical protein n=1 Tax=Paenibacillus sp. FSL H3-0310 TaxID=2921429 RepID=UPI0030F84510
MKFGGIGHSGPYTRNYPEFWMLSDRIAPIGTKNANYKPISYEQLHWGPNPCSKGDIFANNVIGV